MFIQVLMDQGIVAPVAFSSFYIGLGAMERKSKEEIYQEWRKKFPKTWQVRSRQKRQQNLAFQIGNTNSRIFLVGVGGIVHATGPDPFGNCMPLPRLLLRALCEPSVIGFDECYR